MGKSGWGVVLAVITAMASAQEITADEMIQLEKLREGLTAQGVLVTPEMEVRMLQRLRALRPLMTGIPAAGMPQAMQPASGAPTIAAASIDEGEVMRRLAALNPPQPVTDIKILKDGLLVDGKRFADAEGRATMFATDAGSGRVGYVVEGARSGTGLVKIARVDQPAEAVTIGQVARQGKTWQFTSATGKTLAGELFFPLVDGALLMRDSVGFRYVAGRGIEQVTVPTGWYPVPLQRGNVSTTGWMLLEKDLSADKASPLAALSSLTKWVGAVDANEYALMELKTGRLVEINLSADGKNAYSYSQCRQKNALVNVCDKMTSYESAFKFDGSPNPTHYLWKVDWQRGADGPILVASEGNLGSRLVGVNLDSGKKVVLFERALGVTLLNAQVSPDGTFSLAVRLGLESGAMGDVAAEINARPAIATTAAKAP